MTNENDLLVEILKQVKSAAEAGDALALGSNAVHNLWQAIQALGTAHEPSEQCLSAGCTKPPLRAAFCEEHNAKVPAEWYCVCGFPLASKDAICTECTPAEPAPEASILKAFARSPRRIEPSEQPDLKGPGGQLVGGHSNLECRMERIQSARLVWAMACPCMCNACELFYDVVRDAEDERCSTESGAPRREAGDRAGPQVSRQHCPSCLCNLGSCPQHPGAIFRPPQGCPECASGEPGYALLEGVKSSHIVPQENGFEGGSTVHPANVPAEKSEGGQ
jgi:hypothetical protein